MNIINYSITIELTMTRSLRFPYSCDMIKADDFFVQHRYISENNEEKECYTKAILVLRHAKNFGGSLSCISSKNINKKHICRFSFSFKHLEGLKKFETAIIC